MPDPDYNSMQQAVGMLPPMAMPQAPTAAQTSAFVAQQGMSQLAQMAAVMQLATPQLGPMGTPMFPQAQPTFVGSPGMLPGPGGIMYPLTPAGPASPYANAMGAGVGAPPMGMAAPQIPPGNPWVAPQFPYPVPAYRGALGSSAPYPFAPTPPPPMFDTPFAGAYAQTEAGRDRAGLGGIVSGGVLARGAADVGYGYLGSRLGAMFLGNTPGARIAGGALGFLGAEVSGLSNATQNAYMENVAIGGANMRGYAGGIENLSRRFVSDGPDLSPPGTGFTRSASTVAARQLMDLASSSSFQGETHGRFNTADVMRIAQGAGEEGLLTGVQSPGDMRGRVRDVARSLTSFMELANEPDVVRAIQVMGQMRTSGLSLSETLGAVQRGRTFARMAGTTFEGLSNTGGMLGASTFQSMGLTMGLGSSVGMANMGLATAAQNGGALSPQTMNLLGGAGGLGNLNTMFSGGFLQMPMMAPAMMSSAGGLNANALRMLLGGRVDPVGMAAMGGNNMGALGDRLGTGGLGMALGLQPTLQDAIGRILQSQGPFAQRNTEDRQILALMRTMGLRGSEGFMTSAQVLGMSGTQALARAQELGDPRYFRRQAQQIEADRLDRRSEELRDRDAASPTGWQYLQSNAVFFRDMGRGLRSWGRDFTNFQQRLAGGRPGHYAATERSDLLAERGVLDRLAGQDFVGGDLYRGNSQRGFAEDLSQAYAASRAAGMGGIAAALGGALRSSYAGGRDFAEDMARDQRAVGRFTSQVLNASEREVAEAARHRTAFGSSAEQTAFALRVAGRYNDPYASGANQIRAAFGMGVHVASQFTPLEWLGEATAITRAPNVRAEDILADYVRGRREAGDTRSRQELDRAAGEALPRAGVESSALMRYALTREGLQRMADQNTDAMDFLGPARGGTNPERRERELYGRILSRTDAEDGNQRRRFDRVFENIDVDGVPQAQRDRARSFIAAFRMVRMQRGSADRDRRIADLMNYGEHQLHLDVNGLLARDDRRSRPLMQDDDLVDAVRRSNFDGSAFQMVRNMGQFRRDRGTDATTQRVLDGFRLLSGRRGAVGSLLEGVFNGSTIDNRRLGEQFASWAGDEDKMSYLRASDELVAGIVQRYGRASTDDERRRLINEFYGQADAQGNRVSALRGKYRTTSRWGLFNAGSGWNWRDAFFGEDSYIDRHTQQGTAADEAAFGQTGDAAALGEEVAGQGMGRASDALVRASESLERAARMFAGSAASDQMENILGAGPGARP